MGIKERELGNKELGKETSEFKKCLDRQHIQPEPLNYYLLNYQLLIHHQSQFLHRHRIFNFKISNPRTA